MSERQNERHLVMNIDIRTQIIDALGRNSNARAVAKQIGDVSHVSVWKIAKDERIELKAIKEKPGISPGMRGRIIEALRGSNASPRLIDRRLGNISHVTDWKISKEVAGGERPQGGPPKRVKKCAVRGARAPQAAGRKT